MSKIVTSKRKISRRQKQDVWGETKARRNRQNRPGQHGARGGKMSDYGTQLAAKQLLKGYYNMQERQFRKFFAEARRRRGDTSQNMIELLERRLDAMVYRAKLAPSIFAARQLVGHGHVSLNGKRCNIPSCLVNDGDEVSVIGESMKQNQTILAAQGQNFRDIPDYIQFDLGALKAKFIRSPQLSDVPYPVQMQPNLVVEFYSR